MNEQQTEKAVTHPQGFLEVHSIFYTIQGEGPFTGHPAVFIRLAGCNLKCPACDTDYTSSRFTVSTRSIIALVQEQAATGLVVITGGEPFRQDIEALCRLLLQKGYFVQIETNGSLAPGFLNGLITKDLAKRDSVFIVCSPKSGKINPVIAAVACAFKYVLKADSVVPVDGLPLRALDHTCSPWVARPPAEFTGPVYVQPLDEKDAELNATNTRAAVRTCQKFGYILQLQTHKLLGME